MIRCHSKKQTPHTTVYHKNEGQDKRGQYNGDLGEVYNNVIITFP